MPVIKSAKKKLRQDTKRTIIRAKTEQTAKEAVKKAVAHPTEASVKKAVSLLDKATKTHIFHKNKVARIKSRLARLLNPNGAKKQEAPKAKPKKTVKKIVVKKVVKKTSSKK